MTGTSDAGRVYDAVRRAIVEGRYPPGSRLIEQRVAEELEVSRTPVREALRRLESEGLVVVEPNRGAQVRPLTAAEIGDLYEVRARLEGYGAELAASRAEPADVLEVRNAAAAFSAAAADGRAGHARVGQGRVGQGRVGQGRVGQGEHLAAVRALDAANARFHGSLLAASRHGRLGRLVAGAVDAPLVFQAFDRFAEGDLDRSELFHHLVADAVSAREPERAGRLMTEHVLQGRDVLLQHLSDLGSVAELFAGGAT